MGRPTAWSFVLLFVFGASVACGETVEMINGDVVHGKVIALDQDTLTFQSPTLGQLKIQRSNVAVIQFVGKPAATKSAADSKTTGRRKTSIFDGIPSGQKVLQQLRKQGGIQADDLKAVQQQFPQLATPEVRGFVNDRLSGLISGRLDLGDIRKEAVSAVDQIKDLKKDLGPQAAALDGYLSILENFIDETVPEKKEAAVPSSEAKPAESPKQ